MTDDGRRSGGNDSGDDLLRLAVEGLSDHVLVTLDPHGRITSWNLGAERLLGWSREQTLGRHVSSVVGPGGSDAGIGAADLEDATRLGAVSAIRPLRHRDGGSRPAATTLRAIHNETAAIGYAVSASPIPAAAPVEPAAETSRVPLTRRLVAAQEDERRRLARELHDGLGQRLTALRLILEGLDADANARGEQRARTVDALELLAQIDQDVDFIAWELRPAALDELGLTRVLDTYVKEWSRQVRIPAMFRARPDVLPRFATEVEASLYRIAQEGLNNVAKHARARSVNVLLELRNDKLALVVEDDGVGCHPLSTSETKIGVTGMRERARAVGGTLELEPTPGGGTTVLACIPTRAGYQRPWPSEEDALPAAPAGAFADRLDAGGGASSPRTLRARIQELQQAVGARDEFIATVAHELRNPMTPLTFQIRLALNKTEQLAATGAPVSVDWLQTQLRGIEQRLYRVLETLDRLLDVSRLSTGRIDLQLERMNLAEVVGEVLAGFDAELAVARCRLTLSGRRDATGVWDRVRVEQICRNLVSNAIRFGAGHPIEVTVDADHDFASIAVRDHGIGIDPELQSKIFERFERGVEPRTGGFGVGLWIVRTICAAMGGTVSVESVVGDGALFVVLLPRRPVREPVRTALE